MSESFLTFKRQLVAVNIVKSILAALALGSAVGGALLLLTSYGVIQLDPVYIIPIALAVLLLAGGGCFLLLRRSDGAIAARLDRSFSLEERVQTMLQYKDESGAIFSLQREDAEKALSATKTARFRLGKLWIYIVAVVLGAAVLTSGLIFKPAPPPPPEEVEIPFSMTAIQRAAIEELIAYVRASDMTSPYRENTALHLELMLSELDEATTEKMRDAAITKMSTAVIGEIDEASSGLEIINSLGSSNRSAVLAFARALNFYDWSEGGEFDDFIEGMAKFRAELTVTPDDSGEGDESAEAMASELARLLTETGSAIPSALRSSGIGATDALYAVAESYASLLLENNGTKTLGIARLAEVISEIGYDEGQRQIDALINALSSTTLDALMANCTDVRVGEHAITRVCLMFGVSIPRFERPRINRDGSDDDDIGGGGSESSGGGIGVGTVYGSNDIVLDPETGKYVEYGTILDGYYYDADKKVTDGSYTDEEKKAIEKYYDILYSGFEKKGDN